MNIIDYELIEDVSILFESKIIIYGAGYWAEEILNYLKESGITPVIVCQTEITQSSFYEWEIKSLSYVLDKFDDNRYLLIIASLDYYEEMIYLCENTNNIKICTLYGFFTSIRLHTNEHILPQKLEKKIIAENYISQYNFIQGLKVCAMDQLVKAALSPENYIWIFQPGKVGSQSIWNSIQNRSIQFHSLMTPFRFIDAEEKYLNTYLELIHKKRIKIITSIREPISRDIAAFFQNSDLGFIPYNHYNNNIFWLYGDIEKPEMHMETKDMRRRCPQWKNSLNKSFQDLAHVIMYYKLDLFSWFDYEINRVFGIDVFDYPFDKKKGYTIIEKSNIQIMILNMECLSSLENVIGKFINDDNYKLINRNKASTKIYRYVYESFKTNIKLPSDYFEFYYNGNSKYEHFYSEEDIERSYKYWKKYVNNN